MRSVHSFPFAIVDIIASLVGLGLVFAPGGVAQAQHTDDSAEPAVRHNLLSETVSRSLGILTDNRDISRSSMAGERSSYAGNTISGAMNALPAALGVLKSAFGSDR